MPHKEHIWIYVGRMFGYSREFYKNHTEGRIQVRSLRKSGYVKVGELCGTHASLLASRVCFSAYSSFLIMSAPWRNGALILTRGWVYVKKH